MAAMKTTARLFVDTALAATAEITLAAEQGHYLVNVLRLKPGDPVRLFNGSDGEWLSYLATSSKKRVTVRCEKKLAEATPPPDIDFVFAPLKQARLDYGVQKAVELGARRLRPVITERTIVDKVNLERMRANAIEAAEQCNLVHVPEVMAPEAFGHILETWDPSRALIYCDETAATADPLAALKLVKLPAAVLVGPEGGFTAAEKALITSLPFVTGIALGPRILRADTAAVAAMTLVQAVLGDWAWNPAQ